MISVILNINIKIHNIDCINRTKNYWSAETVSYNIDDDKEFQHLSDENLHLISNEFEIFSKLKESNTNYHQKF